MNNAVKILQQHMTSLPERDLCKLSVICDRLDEMNGVLNLTALKTPEDIAMLHLYDSLTLMTTGLFQDGKKVIDIGCGGGFPALPIASCTDCNLTANDATAKKLAFVADTAKAAGVSISTLCGRAEELTQQAEYREQFDIAVSRGVARLNVLCEWCMPFVKKGGYFIAMKGPGGIDEYEEAKNGIKILGGTDAEIIKCPIPTTERVHTLIVIKKVCPTPPQYPRQNSKIKKKPL